MLSPLVELILEPRLAKTRACYSLRKLWRYTLQKVRKRKSCALAARGIQKLMMKLPQHRGGFRCGIKNGWRKKKEPSKQRSGRIRAWTPVSTTERCFHPNRAPPVDGWLPVILKKLLSKSAAAQLGTLFSPREAFADHGHSGVRLVANMGGVGPNRSADSSAWSICCLKPFFAPPLGGGEGHALPRRRWCRGDPRTPPDFSLKILPFQRYCVVWLAISPADAWEVLRHRFLLPGIIPCFVRSPGRHLRVSFLPPAGRVRQ